MRQNYHSFYTAYVSTTNKLIDMAKIHKSYSNLDILAFDNQYNVQSDNYDIFLPYEYIY